MPDINFAAVGVVTVVCFVLSTFYYIALDRQRNELLALPPTTPGERPPSWMVVAELFRTLVVATVVAGLIDRLGADGVADALVLGLVLWVAFPAVLLSGAVIWDKVPPRLAAIHAGDWLVKLLVISAVVGAWR
ncbi:MAG: DUF1761 domain-containing protein [Marmoricola sp.]